MNKIQLLNLLGRLPLRIQKWLWPRRFVLYAHLISDRNDCMAAQRYRYPTFNEFDQFRIFAEKLNYRFATVEEYFTDAYPLMILLTFDDGFREVYDFHQREKLPFILFITSDALEKNNFDLGVFTPKTGAFLKIEEIIDLKKAGIHIGFHTRSHKKIKTIEDLKNEVIAPQNIIHLISSPRCFAYPFEGPVDYRSISAAIINYGYEFVFDTKFRTGSDGKHVFRIPVDRALAEKIHNPIIANILQARLAEFKRKLASS